MTTQEKQDVSAKMLRNAISSLAVEAGIIEQPINLDEIESSVMKDIYYQQLLAEIELRYKGLSVRYEKLLNQQTRMHLDG